jgi:hypothetical protein
MFDQFHTPIPPNRRRLFVSGGFAFIPRKSTISMDRIATNLNDAFPLIPAWYKVIGQCHI